jgi:hypothetical protein
VIAKKQAETLFFKFSPKKEVKYSVFILVEGAFILYDDKSRSCTSSHLFWGGGGVGGVLQPMIVSGTDNYYFRVSLIYFLSASLHTCKNNMLTPPLQYISKTCYFHEHKQRKHRVLLLRVIYEFVYNFCKNSPQCKRNRKQNNVQKVGKIMAHKNSRCVGYCSKEMNNFDLSYVRKK